MKATGHGRCLPSRASLSQNVVKTLHRGGAANANVLLARAGDRLVVVKDFAPRSFLVRCVLGRWLNHREMRAYAALEGLPAVPVLLGPVDEWAFALEYRPGERLSRSLRGRLAPGFLDELARSIGAMHARGVVHLDLRHRSNVLAGEDGRPVILDYASSLCFRPGSRLARWLVPLFGVVDWLALRKWKVRLDGGGLSERPARPAVAPPAELGPPAGPGGPDGR